MAKFEGKCPRCGKIYYSEQRSDIVTCDCWQHCPLCGVEMVQYTPDSAPKIYGVDGKCEFAVLMVCTSHSPPFFSTQKPVEVEFYEKIG